MSDRSLSMRTGLVNIARNNPMRQIIRFARRRNRVRCSCQISQISFSLDYAKMYFAGMIRTIVLSSVSSKLERSYSSVHREGALHPQTTLRLPELQSIDNSYEHAYRVAAYPWIAYVMTAPESLRLANLEWETSKSSFRELLK